MMITTPTLADDAELSVAALSVDKSEQPKLSQRLADLGLGDLDTHVLPLYSVTKTFTAATVLRSGIDLSSSIDRWFDGALVPRGHDISVQHLLLHRSGIRDYFSASDDYARAVAAEEPAWSDDTFAEHTLRQPLWFEPGTNFGYSNPGYWLLGQIVEKETGRSLAEQIQHHISEPLELQSLSWASAQFAADLPNYPAQWVWPGLLLGNAGDVACFMGSPLVDALRTSIEAVPGNQPGWKNPHYGYGLMNEPGECFGHNGEGPGYSASCFHFQSYQQTLCVLLKSSHPELGAPPDAAMSRLQEIRALLNGQ